MFIDQLTIVAKAGDGGDGVVRWRHEKFVPLAGPAGGDGGNGGSVFLEAVRDNTVLSKYVGATHFEAEPGQPGQKKSLSGHNGKDVIIKIPVGSRVTDTERERVYELDTVGQRVCILEGGRGGFGNEHFKSSTNRSPEESTPGRAGEEGTFLIEVVLAVDVGLIGSPNAGKSSLLNTLTNAQSKVGAYPFTTTEPSLGDLYGFTLADIPGLIMGASQGKGLGHKFLRHVSRTKMLLHIISLENLDALESYYTIIKELSDYNKDLLNKEEWIILSKKDLVNQDFIDEQVQKLDILKKRVFVMSIESGEGVKELQDTLVAYLRDTYNTPIN
ncbi:MAG: GTPase ObgE [Candidatus Paceibacteria bacterium]